MKDMIVIICKLDLLINSFVVSMYVICVDFGYLDVLNLQ